MALTTLPKGGWWIPRMPPGISSIDQSSSSQDAATLDADAEEVQVIGALVTSDDAAHTFGTTSSKIDWLPGASSVFDTGSTLRVGVKKTSKLDATNGPPARATIGAAAFDVYDDLVGGTDTLTSSAWRSDTMTAGTPFVMTPGELHAVCLLLTPAGGSPSVKVRMLSLQNIRLTPAVTLVTSGPTYTAVTAVTNMLLTFDDGALGWFEPSQVVSVADSVATAPGQDNILANILRVPFTVQIDALAALVTLASGTADFALDLYATPLGTPSLLASVTQDATLVSGSTQRFGAVLLPTPQTLTAGVDYAIGMRQLTAGGAQVGQHTVTSAAHWPLLGFDDTCYAVTSTAGATFADALATKRKRYQILARVRAIDMGRRFRARTFTGF